MDTQQEPLATPTEQQSDRKKKKERRLGSQATYHRQDYFIMKEPCWRNRTATTL